MTATCISDVRFTPAGDADVASGLLGYVECTYGDALHLDGLALRRTRKGRFALAFPVRRDSAGRPHPYVRPIDDTTRRAIESAVFEQLALQLEAAP